MSAGWEHDAGRLRAASPRHVLFLCVANAARSQMAEGIARALAPPDVRISSAGSRPSKVDPLAVKVLAEVGIDISSHVSKGVDDLPPDGVDAVVTLCAEEVCPRSLGEATRVHWSLPDPAHAGTTEGERLQAFRDVRDELRKRIAAVFPQPDAGAVRIEPASSADLPSIRALLEKVRLPASDLGSAGQTFFVARSGGALVGAVALERHGADALVRSLAVAPRLQSTGLGKALYRAALAEARRTGTRALYLLTTTASPFFEKAGFRRIDRARAPAAVTVSEEFRALCPASAVCMELVLTR